MKMIFITGLVVAGGLLHAGESQPVDDNFISRLKTEAVRVHPSVMAGKERAEAAGFEVRGVRLWDDPMVGLGLMAARKSMRADQGDIIVGIEQTLPKPGMYAAKRGKAQAVQRAEMENVQAASLSAGEEVARDVIELALADESILLQQTQITWLTAMADNARQLASNPAGSGIDALRIGTELAKEQQLLESARTTRDGLAQKLNLVLGRPLDAAWPVLKLPSAAPPVPLASAEVARVSHASPKVRAMKAMAGAAVGDVGIADRERMPGISIGVDANAYSRGDLRSATVGVKMSLPWFNEGIYEANLAAAKCRKQAADRDVEAVRRDVAGAVIRAVTDAANAAAQARAYAGEIHDKADLTKKTVEAAWLSSKAPLTDLLDASRTLFAIRLEQRRFVAMQMAALEQLHNLVPNR